MPLLATIASIVGCGPPQPTILAIQGLVTFFAFVAADSIAAKFPQFNLQVAGVRRAIRSSAAVVDGRSPGWGEDDLVNQAAKSLGGFDPRVGFLQRLNEAVSPAGRAERGRISRPFDQHS
jgi:hypothetical protein